MTISVTALSDIFEMSRAGSTPYEIQTALGLTAEAMKDAKVVEALERGRAEGVTAVNRVLYGAAAGGAAGAAKYYLERNAEKEVAARPVVHDPNARTDEMIEAHVSWLWRQQVAMLDGVDFDEPEPD